jgi:heme/copper-type cytochrome/quinol oxidase subunit 3
MNRRIVGDLSALPDAAFGSRTLWWWGVLGFILIEGGAFLLAGGAYFFLMSHTDPWPPHNLPPSLLYGTLFTAVALASEAANIATKRAARAEKVWATRLGLILDCLVGLVLIGLRFAEFGALNVRWDDSAYGSIVWALLLLHATHLITDVADTLVLTVFTFTHEVDRNRFSDVADGCIYWHFVVVAWLPIYGLVYWAPRLLG